MYKFVIITLVLSLTFSTSHQQQQELSDVHIKLSELTATNPIREIKSGVNLTLECDTQTTNSLIQWYKDGYKLRWSNKKRIRVIENRLRIKNLNKFDNGDYMCQIITGSGYIKQLNQSIRVIEQPINIDIDKNKSFKQLGKIDPFIDTSSSLDYSDIDNSDESYDYLKGEAPVFIDDDYEVRKYFEQLENSQVELDCNARGLPMPDIMWLKNGEVISEESIGNIRNSMVLTIKDLSVGDSGNYTCQVTNEYGKINRSFQLKILENLVFDGSDPLNQTVEYGESAIFKCKIAKQNAFDRAQIMWLTFVPDDKQSTINSNLSVEIDGDTFVYLKNDDNKFKISIFDNSLIINKVQYEDAGYYLCLANNSKGYNYRKAYLNVIPINPFQYLTSTPILANVTGTHMSLSVFGVVGGAVFVLIIVFICMCMYKNGCKCCSNNDEENESGKSTTLLKTDNQMLKKAPTVNQKVPTITSYSTNNNTTSTITPQSTLITSSNSTNRKSFDRNSVVRQSHFIQQQQQLHNQKLQIANRNYSFKPITTHQRAPSTHSYQMHYTFNRQQQHYETATTSPNNEPLLVNYEQSKPNSINYKSNNNNNNNNCDLYCRQSCMHYDNCTNLNDLNKIKPTPTPPQNDMINWSDSSSNISRPYAKICDRI